MSGVSSGQAEESGLVADFVQFVKVFNTVVFGKYWIQLQDAWLHFLWRMSQNSQQFLHIAMTIRSYAQAQHAEMVKLVKAGIAHSPTLSNLLRSHQLVELLLVYVYSGVLALIIASLISCIGRISQRKQRRPPGTQPL